MGCLMLLVGGILPLTRRLWKQGVTSVVYIDPAMYIYFSYNGGEKVLQGIAVTHVDGILHGGSNTFDCEVVSKVKSSFNFGSEGSEICGDEHDPNWTFHHN